MKNVSYTVALMDGSIGKAKCGPGSEIHVGDWVNILNFDDGLLLSITGQVHQIIKEPNIEDHVGGVQ